MILEFFHKKFSRQYDESMIGLVLVGSKYVPSKMEAFFNAFLKF